MCIRLTVTEIVNELYTDEIFHRLIGKYVLSDDYSKNSYLKEELIQEIALILLQYKNKGRIVDMYLKNQLGYFILGIIRNSVFSYKSPFYYKYLQWERRKGDSINLYNSWMFENR